MKIEVFYVPGCPHHPSAVHQLRKVLLEEGLQTEIKEVVVKDMKAVEKYHFRGSPTIRIDGRDIAGESKAPASIALACRIYPGAAEAGVPPMEMMRCAIREARSGEKA